MARQFAPAVGSHFAVTSVQTDHDVATKGGTGVLQKSGIADRRRANDDIAQPSVKVALDGIEIAYPSAKLYIHRTADFLENPANRFLIDGVSGKRTIEVNQMQATRALRRPVGGHDDRIFAKGGGLLHVTLLEANAVTVFQVNGRN